MILKAKLEKLQFHTSLIVIGMMAFSLLCWFRLFLGTIDYIDRHSSADDEIIISERVGSNEEIEKFGEISTTQDVESSADTVVENQQDWLQAGMERVESAWDRYIYRRTYFCKMDAQITYMLIGEILSSEVLCGKDHWLFYKSKTDGDSIADYEGTKPYTDSEMASILQASLSVQNEMENRGIDFAILVPPNKENVYSEFMPDEYKHAETSSTDLLIKYLSKEGINIVNPKEELLNYHTEYQLYYSNDSHWNQLGAYIGVKSVLNTWGGVEIPPIQNRIISKGNYHAGDLAGIVGVPSKLYDDVEYEIEGTVKMDWIQNQVTQSSQIVSHYENPDAENNGTLLLVGDSFRLAMRPAVCEVYKNVYVAHSAYFRSEMLDEIDPDYVIVEYVERYSRNLAYIDDLLLY